MIKIGSEDGKPGRILMGYYNFVMQRDRIMLNRLKSQDLSHPHLTISKIIGIVGAALVHSVTILLPFFGLWVILSRFAGPFSICYGIFIFGLAYAVRPQLTKRPEEVLSRTQYPLLFTFVDQISDALNAPRVDDIVLNEYMNASFGTYGWRQSTVLFIGYPLWMSLDEQKRVALIGHEIAHQINKDVTRGLFVGTALGTLLNWYRLLYPDSLVDRRYGVFSLPVNLAFWVIANSILAVYLALGQIFLYERRRAEYLADYIGAQLGGTQNMVDMIKWLQRSNPALSINALTTHPSYDFRVEFLNSKKPFEPQFILEKEYSKRLDQELSSLQAEMETKRRRRIKGSFSY